MIRLSHGWTRVDGWRINITSGGTHRRPDSGQHRRIEAATTTHAAAAAAGVEWRIERLGFITLIHHPLCTGSGWGSGPNPPLHAVFSFLYLKKLKFQKYMSVLENFKNIPRSPYGGDIAQM